MKLTRLDGQAFHRSAPLSFHRSAPMSFRAKPRNPSPRLAVAAHMAPLRSHLTRPSPSFRRRPEPSGARGRANEGINR